MSGPRKYAPGTRHGMLVVDEWYSVPRPDGRKTWGRVKCTCDCGGKKDCLTITITQGIMHCGCQTSSNIKAGIRRAEKGQRSRRLRHMSNLALVIELKARGYTVIAPKKDRGK